MQERRCDLCGDPLPRIFDGSGKPLSTKMWTFRADLNQTVLASPVCYSEQIDRDFSMFRGDIASPHKGTGKLTGITVNLECCDKCSKELQEILQTIGAQVKGVKEKEGKL